MGYQVAMAMARLLLDLGQCTYFLSCVVAVATSEIPNPL